MEACLSALTALKECLSSFPSGNEGSEALWELACRWADSVEKLAPGPGQEQLLRAAAEVASLLARAVSKSSGAAEPHGTAKALSTEAETPVSGPQLQHGMAGTTAAAAKATQGLVSLVKKQSPSASSALVQRIADDAAAVLLSICSLTVVWEEPRQLEAVACLANMLVQPASDKNCPASVKNALAQAGVTAGPILGLLRSSVESLEAGPAGQDSRRRQAVRHHAASMAFMLIREAPLNEEFANLLADRQLVQQLLRQAVVPIFADVLQMGAGPAPAPPWSVRDFEILEFVMGDAIRPHARSVLAEWAAPLSMAQGSAAATVEGVAAAGGAAPVNPPAGAPDASCGTTVGGNLVLLGAKALAELGTAYKQASKAEATGKESPQCKSQQEPQEHKQGVPRLSDVSAKAAGLARNALLLTGAMQLLPCVLDAAQLSASQEHEPGSQATASAGSDGSSNSEAPTQTPAAMGRSQRGAKQAAVRAAEPAFLQGIVAVAAALHDLVDSDAVPQLVCGIECLPEDWSSGDLELIAADAVQCLAMAAIAFDGWRDVAAQPSADSWVPQDVALTCAAAEALIRLIGKLQRGSPPAGLPHDEDPQRMLHRMLGAMNAWLLALKERVSVTSSSTRQAQGGSTSVEVGPTAPLTAQQARAAVQPAVDMAFSAVKLYHAARKMSGARKQFGSGADDTLTMVLCSMCMMTASRVGRLVGEACGVHRMPLDVSRNLEAMKVSVLEAAGVFATDAAMRLSGAGSAACGHPSVVMEAVIELVNTAIGAFTTDSSSFIKLAPKVVEASLRMLLAKRDISEDVLGGYRFWSHVGDWFEECPTLCAEVVKSGVLSDSAVWLAGQLERQRGAAQLQLVPEATGTLAGSFHALFPHAVRGLAQLTNECEPPGELASRIDRLGQGLEELMGELHRASEAALGTGPAALASPSFWRGLAAPGGLATVLRGVASAIAVSLAADPSQGHEDHLQLARTFAHRPCSNRSCVDLTGASESELGPGRRCSGCKKVCYCGVGCQRAAWPEHKQVCKRLRDSVEVIRVYI